MFAIALRLLLLFLVSEDHPGKLNLISSRLKAQSYLREDLYSKLIECSFCTDGIPITDQLTDPSPCQRESFSGISENRRKKL